EVAREAPAWAPDKVVIRLHAAFAATRKLAGAVRGRHPGAAAVARAAACAAEAAEYACCDARTRDAARAAEAARAAHAAAPSREAAARLREGWQRLSAAARTEGWTKQTPVPELFFRP